LVAIIFPVFDYNGWANGTFVPENTRRLLSTFFAPVFLLYLYSATSLCQSSPSFFELKSKLDLTLLKMVNQGEEKRNVPSQWLQQSNLKFHFSKYHAENLRIFLNLLFASESNKCIECIFLVALIYLLVLIKKEVI